MPSDVFCRLTPDAWRKSGSKNSVDRAKEMVDKLLTDHVPKPLPLDAEERLDQVFKEILARHGLPQPQPLRKAEGLGGTVAHVQYFFRLTFLDFSTGSYPFSSIRINSM